MHQNVCTSCVGVLPQTPPLRAEPCSVNHLALNKGWMCGYTRTALAIFSVTALLAALWCFQIPASFQNTQPFIQPATKQALSLSMADRYAYRRIFALQEAEKWHEADKLIAGLKNPLLMGKVLAQRYLQKNYITHKDELTAWLARYAPLEEAARLRVLARKKGAAIPEIPATHAVQRAQPSTFTSADRKTEKRFSTAIVRQYLEHSPLRVHVNGLLKQGQQEKALRVVGQTRGVTAFQYDLLRWRIALSHYNHGEYEEAWRLAAASAARSGKQQPEFHWLAGISAWHLADTISAQQHFTAMLQQHHKLSLSDRAAAAFWAHRATQDAQEKTQYLMLAASTGDTFYGIQAGEILSAMQPEVGSVEPSPEYTERLQMVAILAQIGQKSLAMRELQHQLQQADAAQKTLWLKAAQQFNLTLPNPVLLRVRKQDYPLPSALQDQGEQDSALLMAIIRQESGFRQEVISQRGASGLMQIMPATAAALRSGHRLSDWRQNQTQNIQLGSEYLELLGKQSHIEGNLIYMLAAYNAGPGTLSKWQKEQQEIQDPLLFIESIPYAETRSYVQQVLRNYWVYQYLLGQLQERENNPLSLLTAGEWPRYAALAQPAKMAAFSGDKPRMIR